MDKRTQMSPKQFMFKSSNKGGHELVENNSDYFSRVDLLEYFHTYSRQTAPVESIPICFYRNECDKCACQISSLMRENIRFNYQCNNVIFKVKDDTE